MSVHLSKSEEHTLNLRVLRFVSGLSAEQPFDLARDLLAAGRESESSQVVELALRTGAEINDIGLLIDYAREWLARGALVQAQRWLLLAARHAPDRPEPLEALAEVLTRRKQHERAARVLERAATLEGTRREPTVLEPEPTCASTPVEVEVAEPMVCETPEPDAVAEPEHSFVPTPIDFEAVESCACDGLDDGEGNPEPSFAPTPVALEAVEPDPHDTWRLPAAEPPSFEPAEPPSFEPPEPARVEAAEPDPHDTWRLPLAEPPSFRPPARLFTLAPVDLEATELDLEEEEVEEPEPVAAWFEPGQALEPDPLPEWRESSLVGEPAPFPDAPELPVLLASLPAVLVSIQIEPIEIDIPVDIGDLVEIDIPIEIELVASAEPEPTELASSPVPEAVSLAPVDPVPPTPPNAAPQYRPPDVLRGVALCDTVRRRRALDGTLLRFIEDPTSADAAELMQELLLLGRVRDAADVGALAVDSETDDVDLLLTYAQALEVDDNPAGARLALERAIERDPSWVEPWRRSADLALRCGDTAAAVSAMDRIELLAPDHPSSDRLRARVLAALRAEPPANAHTLAAPTACDVDAEMDVLIAAIEAPHAAPITTTLPGIVAAPIERNPYDMHRSRRIRGLLRSAHPTPVGLGAPRIIN